MEFRLTIGYCGSAAAVRIFVINHSSKSFATTFQQQQQLAMSEYWIAHKLHGQLKQSQSMRYCIIRKIIHWVWITKICMYTECSNQKHASSSRLAAHKRKGYRSTCIQWRRTGDKEQGAQIRLGRWDRDGRIEGIMHSAASTGSLDGEAHGDVASHPIASARGPIHRRRAAHWQLLLQSYRKSGHS